MIQRQNETLLMGMLFIVDFLLIVGSELLLLRQSL
jgi:hypothetical protein